MSESKQFTPNCRGWDGSFSLTMRSLIASSLEEVREFDDFMATPACRDLPPYVHMAVAGAWWRAKESLASHRRAIADYCAPWFDESAFK